MARSLNKVTLIGRIQPNDPELRYTQTGRAVCSFKVVTDESYKDKEGQTHERSEWHRIVFWGKAGEIIANYMKKGRQIYIEGRLQTRQYEHEGQTRYQTEIVGNDFLFLGGPGENDGGSSQPSYSAPSSQSTPQASPVSAAPDTSGAEDDDLPF